MKPGTVSKILWHFTGGPDWDNALNKQKSHPKDQAKAYETLKLILKSNFLKLSTYNELIKVIVPFEYRFDKIKKERYKEFNIIKEIKSSKVVCLADIPIQHIEYHALRYGKFTIGFHRESAIRNGFNPVFYTHTNSKVINSIYSGFMTINSVETDNITNSISEIENETSDIQTELDDNDIDSIDTSNISSALSDIENEISDIENSKTEVMDSLEDFVAFVKTFDENEIDTIYCEREWRALEKFTFNPADIAMIILPKENGYYEDLLKSKIVPENIPIIPWEDIIEH